MAKAPPTIIMDIDGCLFEQHVAHDNHGDLTVQLTKEAKILPGVREKFRKWDAAGYRIIILTGRPESCREETIKQLKSFGLFWQQLVMGVGGGERHLFNDCKPDGTVTAFAHPLIRNKGLEDAEIKD